MRIIRNTVKYSFFLVTGQFIYGKSSFLKERRRPTEGLHVPLVLSAVRSKSGFSSPEQGALNKDGIKYTLL